MDTPVWFLSHLCFFNNFLVFHFVQYCICDVVSYSLKTNYEVGKVVEDMDCWFSAHSIEAVDLIKDKSRTWFFAQAWDMDELNQLVNIGIRSFVVDNMLDLNILLKYLDNSKVRVNLLLRMRLKEHTIN